jgi:hypothetical protein
MKELRLDVKVGPGQYGVLVSAVDDGNFSKRREHSGAASMS